MWRVCLWFRLVQLPRGLRTFKIVDACVRVVLQSNTIIKPFFLPVPGVPRATAALGRRDLDVSLATASR